MIKTLDRYIIWKFLTTFFFTVLLFTILSVVIDFSEKADKLMDENVPVEAVVFDYFVNFIPYINGILWPLFTLISVVFFTSRMARDNEILSLLNAGVSFHRITRPYFISAFIIAGIHYFGSHYLIPVQNETRIAFEREYLGKDRRAGRDQNIHLFVGPDTALFVRYYRTKDSVAREIRLEFFRDDRLYKVIKGGSLAYDHKREEWLLSNYSIREISDMENRWTDKTGDRKYLKLNLNPEDFLRYTNEKEVLTSPEIEEFVKRELERGRGNTRIYLVEKYRRTADAFSILILMILGMSISSRKVRGGMGLHLASGLGLGALFIFLSRFANTYAINEQVSPVIGVWIPNIFFTVVAIYFYLKAQR